MRNRAWLLGVALLAGCAGAMGPPQEPFTHSSLGPNLGKPHELEIEVSSLGALGDRLIELARVRELTLVKQSCEARSCLLAFRSKPLDRRIFKGTTNLVLSYYSRYFIWLEPTARRTRVSAVGVPVLGGEMACPAGWEQRLGCRTTSLNRHPDRTLVASVKEEWGYDVSGANEAETLQGLLDELRQWRPKAASGVGSGASGKRRAAIVAVFDIEDQSGRIGNSVLAQLTEYLAAKVTQVAGYQVVPREQLRSRLVAQKRESFKQCYDQRCQIELGKAVAAEKSLATKLIRVGKTCALTSLLYDLKTEATERAATVKTECTEESLLGGMEQLARQLAAGL
jgi:hypothetical protein